MYIAGKILQYNFFFQYRADLSNTATYFDKTVILSLINTTHYTLDPPVHSCVGVPNFAAPSVLADDSHC